VRGQEILEQTSQPFAEPVAALREQADGGRHERAQRGRRLGRREGEHGRRAGKRGHAVEAIEQERRRERARLVRGERRLQAGLHDREAGRLRHHRHRDRRAAHARRVSGG